MSHDTRSLHLPMHCTRCQASASAPLEARGASGRARCFASGPHEPPPHARARISEPFRTAARPPAPLSSPGPLMGPGGQTERVGAMWRPRVLPSTDACACAGGFESLLRGREGFEPQSNGQCACEHARSGKREIWDFGPARRAVRGGSICVPNARGFPRSSESEFGP